MKGLHISKRITTVLVYFLVACGLFGLGGLLFLSQSILAKQFAPQPERFTQLYFSNFRQLPTSLRPHTDQNVDFTVHNLEHQPVDYRYKIMFSTSESGPQQLLAEGSLRLRHNDSKALRRAIVVPPFEQRAKVSVQLSYQNAGAASDEVKPQTQSIHYWVTAPDNSNLEKDSHEAT